MRELMEALSSLETSLEEAYGITLKEAMVLCCIGREMLTAGEVVERAGLSRSHTSKVLSVVEQKSLLKRTLGERDKRMMYFSLTKAGLACLDNIKMNGIEVPDFLVPLFKDDIK